MEELPLTEARDKRIFDLWLACNTNKEIAESVGLTEEAVRLITQESADLPKLGKPDQSSAEHTTDFDPPLYNIWKQGCTMQPLGNVAHRVNTAFAVSTIVDISDGESVSQCHRMTLIERFSLQVLALTSMVGARARKIYDREAKERQHEGQKSGGRGNTKNSVENLPPSLDSGKARDAVGKAIGVSGKSIDHATRAVCRHSADKPPDSDDKRCTVV